MNATVKTPEQVNLDTLQDYDLIGFGSGIDSGKHYKPLLDFVESLPETNKTLGFIFSTSAMQGDAKVATDHSMLKKTTVKRVYRSRRIQL